MVTKICVNRISSCRENTSATTYVECFNDNYDVIGHVVWQPCWKNGKPWTSVSLKPQQEINRSLAHGKYSSWGISLIFL